MQSSHLAHRKQTDQDLFLQGVPVLPPICKAEAASRQLRSTPQRPTPRGNASVCYRSERPNFMPSRSIFSG